MAVEILAPRDVRATLNYCGPHDEPSYCYVACEPPTGVPPHNISSEARSAIIYDARGKEGAFGLDTSGFQWVNYSSTEKEFVDEERIKTVYYPEVEDILKEYAGAKRVLVYSHTIRRSSIPETEPVKLAARGPAHAVHADHSFASALRIVEHFLPDDAKRLLMGRCQIINVWRPIANTVAHDPLALADLRTVDINADLVPMRVIHATHESESCHVKYNPKHKWYYLSDQTPDEVTLLKCFDSDIDKASLTPHSAFRDMTSPPDAPPRQSIEVRALVFDKE